MRAPRTAKRRLLATLGAFALLLSACADDAPQDALKDLAGSAAKEADGLWDITFAIAVVIFFLVEGVLVYTLLKFRQKPGREASQFHGNTKLEVTLTVIPSLILAGLAVPTVGMIFDQAERPANALNISVTAKQFWWEYEYPDLGLITANEMHVPVGQPVYLTLKGVEDDVIHSFWVPKLVGAQDAVPGRENTLIFTAEEAGTYLGQCKEFCGLSHANMRLKVIADPSAEFDAWVADQTAPAVGSASAGQELFTQNACSGCHAIEGVNSENNSGPRLGPNLTHLASRSTFAGAIFDLNEANLLKWVADAPSMKPGVRMPSGTKELGLSQEQVADIVAYLLTLE